MKPPKKTAVVEVRPTTSASNIFRRALCPGSGTEEQGLASEENEFSSEGQMLHKLFMTGVRPKTLTGDQAEALDVADGYAKSFFDTLRQTFSIPDDSEFIDEREVPLSFQGADGKPLFPGHADLIRFWPEYDVRGIVDAKFGFLEVDYAADNLQLASYAVARHQADPAEATGVCIVQPRNFGPRQSSAVYPKAAIPQAAAEIERIYRAALVPDAPRIPGAKQCHYCRAKAGKCSAYAAQFLDLPKGEIAIQTTPNAKLEELYVAIAFASKIKEEVMDEMRKRVEAGALPGWKLQNTGDVRELTNATALYTALKAYFKDRAEFTAQKFDDCRSMAWGKLEALVIALTGISEKKAKELIDNLSAGLVTKTPKAKRIVREKPTALQFSKPAAHGQTGMLQDQDIQ